LGSSGFLHDADSHLVLSKHYQSILLSIVDEQLPLVVDEQLPLVVHSKLQH
jgi:hypothetical protein